MKYLTNFLSVSVYVYLLALAETILISPDSILFQRNTIDNKPVSKIMENWPSYNGFTHWRELFSRDHK